jgi:hypothetical protein
VSPQFHIKLDPLFQTVKGPTKQESHNSLWQIKSGFVLQKDNEPTPVRNIRKSGKHAARVSEQANEQQGIVTTADTNDIPEIAQQLMQNIPLANREDIVQTWSVPRRNTLFRGRQSLSKGRRQPRIQRLEHQETKQTRLRPPQEEQGGEDPP